MARDHILAIDQGTTSTRAVVYDLTLHPRAQAQVEVPPTYPKPGWVEHDARALVESVGPMVTEALEKAAISAQRIAAIGITNQRETAVIWDRKTGQAIGPAIVWQDRRTAPFCEQHRTKQDWLTQHTGLVLDSYFSATKFAWLLDHVEGARQKAEAGDLAAGTIDSLLLWHLTGGERHVTDVTNASRTLLMSLHTRQWADDLRQFFEIPAAILPEILPSAGLFGKTRGLGYLPDGLPITGVAGDQQASLAGQACFKEGQAKCTYGTGAFLLVNTGERIVHSSTGLVSTAAAAIGEGPQPYALEGSVFIAGAAVQWFRDGLKAIGAPGGDQRPVPSRRPRVGRRVRAGVDRPGGTSLGAQGAGHRVRTDPSDQHRGSGPCHHRGRGAPDRRPGSGDERRPGHASDGASRRWGHGPLRPVSSIPGRFAGSDSGAKPRHRIHRAGRGASRRVGGESLERFARRDRITPSRGPAVLSPHKPFLEASAPGAVAAAVDTVKRHYGRG